MAHPWEWLTRRSWEQRQGGPCPACGCVLLAEADAADAAGVVWVCSGHLWLDGRFVWSVTAGVWRCTYRAPVPVDVQLRWQGAPMLPGFARREGRKHEHILGRADL
jgi:formylglycine-generating enzyme required for sulfatase activity